MNVHTLVKTEKCKYYKILEKYMKYTTAKKRELQRNVDFPGQNYNKEAKCNSVRGKKMEEMWADIKRVVTFQNENKNQKGKD